MGPNSLSEVLIAANPIISTAIQSHPDQLLSLFLLVQSNQANIPMSLNREQMQYSVVHRRTGVILLVESIRRFHLCERTLQRSREPASRTKCRPVNGNALAITHVTLNSTRSFSIVSPALSVASIRLLIRSAKKSFGICRPFGCLYISVHIDIGWATTWKNRIRSHRCHLPATIHGFLSSID
jgi:hypothetical protein